MDLHHLLLEAPLGTVCRGLMMLEQLVTSGYWVPATIVRDMLKGMQSHSGAWALVMARAMDLNNAYFLLEEAGIDLYATEDNGRTLMHCAAEGNQPRVIKFLLDMGKEWLNKVDMLGQTPLHLASLEGHAMCVKVLLEAGAEVNLTCDQYTDTPLHICAALGFNDCLELLLAKSPDLEKKNWVGVSPLFMALFGQNWRGMEMLVGAGADVNATRPFGDTPLHACADCGFTRGLEALLKSPSAELEKKDRYGRTTLISAICRNQGPCTRMLVEAGADVNAGFLSFTSALHYSTFFGFTPCFKVLIEGKTDVNERNDKGQTPLHVAALYDYAEIVQLLLDAGARLELRDKMGFTPLHCSANKHNLRSLQLLIQAGANVKARTKKGETPLQLCVNGKCHSPYAEKECIKVIEGAITRNLGRNKRYARKLKRNATNLKRNATTLKGNARNLRSATNNKRNAKNITRNATKIKRNLKRNAEI